MTVKNKPIRPISCPNCGAAVSGSKCEFCGSIFWDFADMEIGKAAFVRIRIRDKTFICKAIPLNIDLHTEVPTQTVYADNTPYMVLASLPEYSMEIGFRLQAYGADGKEQYRVVMDDAPERDKFMNIMEEPL
jgi:hypothetical protein